MTGVEQIRELAETIHTMRPTWDKTAISNQLLGHRTIPVELLTTAAISCAQDQTNRTPAALGWMTIASAQPSERVNGSSNYGPSCYTCGRSRSACWEANRREFERGIPDPHDFETFEDAERRSTGNRIEGAA